MRVGVPKEIKDHEDRVGLVPSSVAELVAHGHEVLVETNAGRGIAVADDAYRAAGVTVVETAAALYDTADIIAKVRPPETSEVDRLGPDKTLISFFYPAQNSALLEQAKDKGATVVAMDMVPRISRAQKMDALSSMANIAGYRAVIEAGNNFGRFFTGQVTAAGKVPPAKVLVIGAGVAGLAAIGTAATVTARTSNERERSHRKKNPTAASSAPQMGWSPSRTSDTGAFTQPWAAIQGDAGRATIKPSPAMTASAPGISRSTRRSANGWASSNRARASDARGKSGRRYCGCFPLIS